MAREIIYSVFVSSTYEDLREERAAVQKALLQLHCMPIGMELFGSADEETWEFIKRQIDDCDYYVVLVADKYGSTADEGISYTEKEYDYAREGKKPVLAFVHGDRKSIRRDRTEDDPEKRAKLEAFIQKVGRSPVSFFSTPHELASQVTVSFVNFRDRRPAVGFIRADEAPDLKRYAELLEENARLRDELSKTKSRAVEPFTGADEKFLLRIGGHEYNGKEFVPVEFASKEVTWGEMFAFVAETILRGDEVETDIEKQIKAWIDVRARFSDLKQLEQIKFRLAGRRLIEVLVDQDGLKWKLTSYGQDQYGLFRA